LGVEFAQAIETPRQRAGRRTCAAPRDRRAEPTTDGAKVAARGGRPHLAPRVGGDEPLGCMLRVSVGVATR